MNSVIGCHMSGWQGAACAKLLDLVLNPKNTAEKVFRRMTYHRAVETESDSMLSATLP
jgi:hypothetical protein